MIETPDQDSFTAPAGALTLLSISGWSDREALLEVLESSRHNGLHELIELRDGDSQAEQLPFVTRTLERWLRACPAGPLEPGPAAAEAIAAMACCWSAAVTHALADAPRTLSELDPEVPAIYSVEITREHVEALVRTGQAETTAVDGRLRYALTEWGREAAAPLIAAAHHEIHFPQDDVMAPEILDVEATFQLIVPLLRLSSDLHGECHLSVQLSGEKPLRAGATVQASGGRIVSSSILLEENPETWVTGSPMDWCETVVDPSVARLKSGGDTELADALVQGLHERLFGGRPRCS